MGCSPSVEGVQRRVHTDVHPERLVTPPVGAHRGSAPLLESRNSTIRLFNAANLRIEVPRPPSRDRLDVGLADTPSGAQASEYKFFCPLCMVFYREIFETTCCRSYLCSFCHAEFLIVQAKKKAAAAAPADTKTAAPAGDAPRGEKCIPQGLACPCCAVESTGMDR